MNATENQNDEFAVLRRLATEEHEARKIVEALRYAQASEGSIARLHEAEVLWFRAMDRLNAEKKNLRYQV